MITRTSLDNRNRQRNSFLRWVIQLAFVSNYSSEKLVMQREPRSAAVLAGLRRPSQGTLPLVGVTAAVW